MTDYTEKILKYFSELCAIPRRSGNERRVSEWLAAFARERGLECHTDRLFNVVIKKPASAGSAAAPVILQGHTDMVCASAPDCAFSPEHDGVRLIRDGDYLRADGTTLGADNGIAVAAMLALLDSSAQELRHPPLECVFTVQEETGLSGAKALDASLLTGRTMINLDSEEDGVATVSCAGGKRMRLARSLAYEKVTGCALVITVTGLRGGHSGSDIGFDRVNAIKLIGELISLRGTKGRLCDIWGGEADNAIPRKASATLVYAGEDERSASLSLLRAEAERISSELSHAEPSLKFVFEEHPTGDYSCIEELTSDLFERLVMLAPSGVRTRNSEAGGFVVSSENLGVVGVDGKRLYAVVSLRSSEARMMRVMSSELELLADTLLFDCEPGAEYPGWTYAEKSPLRDVMQEVYHSLFGGELRVEAIHAGLECGIFTEKLPGLDAVAIGPTIRGCHTPEETLCIPSVGRVAALVCATLEELADRGTV